MIVALDTTFLLYIFAPIGHVGTPLDAGGKPLEFAKERVSALVEDWEKTGAKIIVSTPALSEVMVRAGAQAGQSYVAIMNKSKAFKIASFDERAAIEVAIMAGNAVKGHDLKSATAATHAKMKYDRQIVAVACVEGAKVFYTDDGNQRTIATRAGLAVKGLEDCLVPTVSAQTSLPLNSPGDT